MCNSKRLCENEECQTCFEKSFASHEKSQYWSDKNGDVKPIQIFKSSRNKYWFDCDCGHSFNSTLNHITALKPTWCPYCCIPPLKLCKKDDCQSCFKKSFASHEKSNHWSHKNGEIKPRQVFNSSNKKYLFNCECGHEFDSSLNNITGQHNTWCSYCANQKLCEKKDCQSCHEKSFASHEKSKYWSHKNGEIKPQQVFNGSNKKYWFDCGDCGHEFESSLNEITGQHNTWCSYCANKKLCEKESCQSCLEKSFASHEKSQYWSDKNGEIKPIQVFKSANTKYWFDCGDCGHEFNSILYNITGNNQWCAYCSNPPQKLCEKDDCQSCYENSFASHEKSKYWSKKNGHVKPIQVFKGSSNAKYWFDCNTCGHQFNIRLADVTGNNSWCSYCANKKLCEKESCKICFEKSFASHEKSKYWSEKNGEIKPIQVFKSANTKYWFNCDCGHEFNILLNNLTGHNHWCSYCSSPPQKLCEKEDCQSCFEKSFASHEKSKYWSEKNGEIKPIQVFKGSHRKYWFNCDCGHDFNSELNNITGRNPTWCSICVNKTEKKLYEQLLQIYPNIKPQFCADWCKNPITTCFFRFDFALEEQKVIIELDGPQHFVQISNWKTPEEQFDNDQYKEKCANENGYSIIRIIQKDVWNDTYDWFNKLTQNIIKITSENKIQNIYMCKNNEYSNFNS